MDSSWCSVCLALSDQDPVDGIARCFLFRGWHGKILALHYESNIHDLKPSIWLCGILSELLIEDEALIERPSQFFSYLYSLSLWQKCILRLFQLIKPFGRFNCKISFFNNLLDSFLHLKSAWSQYFVKRIGRIYHLNSEYSFFENTKWKTLIRWLIGSFRAWF